MSDGSAIKTIFTVALIATAAASVVTASWEFSRDRIAANRRARLLENLNSVLDQRLAGEDLNPILISATDEALLGSSDPIDVFVPMQNREPVAIIFAPLAPDGYNAPIYLLIGISATDANIMGVRVVSHRETPGLGDLIDIRKSDWILQFNGTSLMNPAVEGWAVDKDEGQFDSITGATVTPRAIVKAVRNTLLYFREHQTELLAAARQAAVIAEQETAQ